LINIGKRYLKNTKGSDFIKHGVQSSWHVLQLLPFN